MTVDVRPLREADVEAAERASSWSLREMSARYCGGTPRYRGGTPLETSEKRADRIRGRIRHLLRTDPGGAWVAKDGDAVVGAALATVRWPLWFLSLFAVVPSHQTQGVGRRLLNATLTYAEGCPAGWILASEDPKALRRYARAGFALHPAYQARGRMERALLPRELGVREGDLARDREMIEDVATQLRGAPHGPDLDHVEQSGQRLLVVDGEGYVWLRPQGVQVLGARSVDVACRLLWAALAEAIEDEVEVSWLTAGQQWAIDVALGARLSLQCGRSSCLRGAVGPLTPYLPSGAYG